jgi:hypothetical protein
VFRQSCIQLLSTGGETPAAAEEKTCIAQQLPRIISWRCKLFLSGCLPSSNRRHSLEASSLKSSIIAGVSILALATTAFAAEPGVRPMFKSGINRHDPVPGREPLGGLTTFTLKWTYSGKSYNSIFVGAKPNSGKSTTVPVYIIPMKLTYGSTTVDPTAPDYTGSSPVTNTVNSPIFGVLDYKQNGVDLGTTQYEDAFERAVLWGKVQKHPTYHVLLGAPTVEPVQAYTVPKADGGTSSPFGIPVVTADINWLDTQVNNLIKSLKIPPNSLPIFITTQTYLTSGGGCCIGGYHSYTGSQAYSVFTYISNSSSTVTFGQDVAALSHEVGEWLDDPLTNNGNVPSACGIYEVGDPLEGTTNYGAYPYTLNGMVYHLQDLVTPPYFGAPASTSLKYNQSFQGYKFRVCQNGG